MIICLCPKIIWYLFYSIITIFKRLCFLSENMANMTWKQLFFLQQWVLKYIFWKIPILYTVYEILKQGNAPPPFF